MRYPSPRRSRRGFTLIEVMISFVVLVILALAITSALLPLEKATTRGNVDLDLDRNARKVLAELRRELRQTGQGNGVERLTIPAAGATITTAVPPAAAAQIDLLQYQMRTGPDEAADWGPAITIRAVPDTAYTNVPANSVNRYSLVRIQGAQSVTIARNVSRVSVTRPAGGSSVQIAIDVTRPDPQRVDPNTIPNPITHSHTDTIEYYNK